MEVNYDQLGLAQQLLARQADSHLSSMRSYLTQFCTIEQGDLGLILYALKPLADLSVTLGTGAIDIAASLATASAEAVTATIDEYIASDKEAADAANAMAVALGGSAIPFVDPRGSVPTLGDSESSAPYVDSWDGGEKWMYEQAIDEATDFREGVLDRIDTAADRIGAWSGGAGAVVERDDPSSYLDLPMANDAAIEDVRWSAGPLIGGIDWVFEEITGISIMEDYITKPLAGNWTAIDKASSAWANLGGASLAIGKNFSALPGQTESWTGGAADQFRVSMAAMGGAFVGLSYAFEYVSGLASTISAISNFAAGLIASALEAIAAKLLRMAAEACVPVIGWAAAAAEIGIMVVDIIQNLLTVYKVCNMIMDAVYDFVEAKGKLVDVAFIIEDLVQGFTRSTVRSMTA